jgi:cytochrome P450
MSRPLSTLPSPQPRQALKDYSQDPLGFMTRCAREFQEIVPLRLDGELYCLLTNPDHITEVLKDRQLFIKAEDTRLLRGLLGNGLLTSEGDFWQRQRRLAQPVFHQQRIQGYGEVMVDYAQRLLQTWRGDGLTGAKAGTKTGGAKTINVHDEMMRLTLDIVMKTIFDQDITDGDAHQVAQALDGAMNWFMGQGAANQGLDNHYYDAVALLDKTVQAMIHQRRRSQAVGDDLLGMLMQVEDADDGTRMSDRQLRDEVVTLMLAGHETTANTLSWTWMLLAQHPNVRSQLQQELQAVLQGRQPAIADLPQLPYTNQVIREAMRLYPPVTDVSRQATQDCEIGGYRIPKGCTLVASQWVMHRDPRYFQQPEIFNPGRWADDLEKRLPRGVYFPFGDGPRICIGKSFAQMESVLILAAIAQEFQLDLVPNQAIELQPSITLRPKHGLKVVLSPLATPVGSPV